MTRKGTPPVVSFKTGNPTHPPDVANKDYVDTAVIPPNPGPPQQYDFQGNVEIDRVAQGYIPTGVNTTFSFSVLGGLLYKNGDFGNELPQTPLLRNFSIRSIRVFNNSISQNDTILEITFIKDDVEFERFELTIPARSRNSNPINIATGLLPFFTGEHVYATIKISGAIAANFCTVVLTQQYEVSGVVNPVDTAMQVKDTAKQQSPGHMAIKKTFSQRILAIFR